MIGLLVFTGYAIAQDIYNYSIGIVIEIPPGSIEITGLGEDQYGNLQLKKPCIERRVGNCYV